jgi:NTE family protein
MAKVKPVNIALQGGGSHGAFTWGVLDRLLEDGRLSFEAISGTSAGAMNAVALADGWMHGRADGAREKLDGLWRAVGRTGHFSPVQRTPWDMLWGNWSMQDSPSYLFFDNLSRMVSPYAANPFDFNPLRDAVEAQIDFDRVRACDAAALFISATNVETGELRVFETAELSLAVVMASACLPTIFKAVEIDGIPYWDGGYGGNPALFPFFYASRTEDVLLVQINPILRKGAPTGAREIQNRIDEITFNAALLREFRAIAFVKKLIAEGRVDTERYRDIRMHRIDADEALSDLTAASKVNAERAFLEYLRDLGRAAAEDWLETCFPSVGKRPTLELSDALSPEIDTSRHRSGRSVQTFLATHKRPRN